MTAEQALTLIQQFVQQAPFAIWIADGQGRAVYANRKLHEMLKVPEHPSPLIGVNLFTDPSVRFLGLTELVDRARKGETVSTVLDLPKPMEVPSQVRGGREEALALKLTAYALFTASQKITNYAVVLEDITEQQRRRNLIEKRIRDLNAFLASKDVRRDRLNALKEEAEDLERKIRSKGTEPAAS
jgi:PAS domain-containing protein